MPEVKWTDEQLAAIESRGGALLVSAAAGSGKTAVLVERLLRRVINDREDITSFLMITYTNAAATELREKILSALSERISRDINDAHLRRQMMLAYSASISTIHAFCTRILRTHGHVLSLPGDFKVLDENEGKDLRRELCEDVIEECYAESWFLPAAQAMFGDRDDRALYETVLMLCDKSRSQVYPQKWLEKLGEQFLYDQSAGVQDTCWGEYLIEQIREILESAGEMNRSSMEYISTMWRW